jgi:hypothetical protein
MDIRDIAKRARISISTVSRANNAIRMFFLTEGIVLNMP